MSNTLRNFSAPTIRFAGMCSKCLDEIAAAHRRGLSSAFCSSCGVTSEVKFGGWERVSGPSSLSVPVHQPRTSEAL